MRCVWFPRGRTWFVLCLLIVSCLFRWFRWFLTPSFSELYFAENVLAPEWQHVALRLSNPGEQIVSVAVSNSGLSVVTLSSRFITAYFAVVSSNEIHLNRVWSMEAESISADEITHDFFGVGNYAGFFAVSVARLSTSHWSRDGEHWSQLPVKASSIGYFRFSRSWVAASIGQAFVSYDGYTWLPDVPLNSLSHFSFYAQSRQIMNAVAVSTWDDSIMTGHL
jgi:hypothetical protein